MITHTVYNMDNGNELIRVFAADNGNRVSLRLGYALNNCGEAYELTLDEAINIQRALTAAIDDAEAIDE